MDPIVVGDSHQQSDQLKVNIRLKRPSVEPVELHGFVVGEHAKLCVEHGFHDKREVLLAHTSLVYAWLVGKDNPQLSLERVSSVLLRHVNELLE